MEEQKVCAIYARVSPTRHIKSENDLHVSLEAALRMCRSQASMEGYKVFKEYIDEYVSGKSSKAMPAFSAMLQDASEGQFTRIFSRRVNRFGRNRKDMLTAQIELEEWGVSLKFIESGIDTALPMGKSMMGMLAELAQMEREEILENTRRGREAAKAKGVQFGPHKKDLDVRLVRKLRMLPVSDPDRPTWAKLEKMTGVSRVTIISRLKAEGFWDYENRKVI